MLDSIFNGISNIIKAITELPLKIVEGIGNILREGWQILTNILNTITEFVGKFFTTLWDFFVDLFKFLLVPEENFFDDKFTEFKNKLNAKVDITEYLDVLDKAQNPSKYYIDGVEHGDSLFTINLFGKEFLLIDFTIYINVKKTLDSYIRGFMFILLALYNYSEVYKLIRGVRPFDPVKSQGK